MVVKSSLVGNITLGRLAQLKKALSPMLATLFGMVTLIRLVQP
jgi:TctA family transporter